ncbi:phosphorylase family protein [Kaistia defluvii]|uniref:Nucleoside phosphorylase/CheY-like chemotaxis protein n=1 Tax=Kaistia defluvii TaxID=410841 RepID=A0ABV2R0V8_9HYPH
MIRILLVEDETEKARVVSDAIVNASSLNINCLTHCNSLVEAKRNLQNNYYDLMVIDLNIPTRTDLPVKGGAGIELLQSLSSHSDKYNIPKYVIGLSAYPESIEGAELKIKNPLWPILKFAHDESDWVHGLQSAVRHIVTSDRPPFVTDGRTYHTTLGVVVGLEDLELESVLALDPSFKQISVRHDPTRYFAGTLSGDGRIVDVVVAAAPKMGLPVSAVVATKLVETFRPRYLAMTGICAGVRGKTEIGDILIADPCWDWGSGKLGVDQDERERFLNAPYQWRLNAELRSKAKDISTDSEWLKTVFMEWEGERPINKPRILIDAVASGASVLQRRSAMDAIVGQHKNLIGVEMEIFSVLTAAEISTAPQPLAIGFKSVCDFGDENKNDGHQRYAAYTSARFLKKIALAAMAPSLEIPEEDPLESAV